MKLLLDTHTFIWYVLDAQKLSSRATELINEEGNEVFVSLASVWEMAIKQNLGRLNFNLPLQTFVEQQLSFNDFQLLNIRLDQLAAIATLPYSIVTPSIAY